MILNHNRRTCEDHLWRAKSHQLGPWVLFRKLPVRAITKHVCTQIRSAARTHPHARFAARVEEGKGIVDHQSSSICALLPLLPRRLQARPWVAEQVVSVSLVSLTKSARSAVERYVNSAAARCLFFDDAAFPSAVGVADEGTVRVCRGLI